MAKGNIAKENVTKKIMAAFGADFVTEQDKKLYVWADDGGERVQIAISMTCPKTPVAGGDSIVMISSSGGGLDFENMDFSAKPTGFKPAEITAEEQKNIDDLMEKLGLI